MKLLWILVAAAALMAACDRGESTKPSAAGGSMETPKGAVTGQASEGSTNESTAPKRPASK